MLFGAPALDDASDNDILNSITSRPTSAGDYAGAVITDSFYGSTPGAALRGVEMPYDDVMVDQSQGVHRGPPKMVRTDIPLMDEDQWKDSPYYRQNIPFDGRMTEARAKFKADVYDDNQYRSWLREQRANGVGTAAIAIGGSLLGSAPDPVNYIPFFGPAFKAAAAGRMANILLRAGTSAADAAIGTALTEPAIAGSRQQFGDDTSFADAMLDIGIGASLGGILGGVHGWRERLPSYRPELGMASVHNLAEAADQVVDGRPIDVGPEAHAEAVKAADRQGLAPEPVDAVPDQPWRREYDLADPVGSTQRFADEAIDPQVQRLALDYGDISDTSVKRIADNAGIDVTGYKQILDAQAYRKISRKHGDAEAELSRGQMPLTTEDFARIPEIVDKAQIIERSEMKSGQPGINFTARLEDGTTFLVQEVRSGRKALAPKTMFKWKEGSEPIDVRERLDQAMATDQTGLSKSPVPENPGIEPNSTAVPAAEENIGAEAGSRKLEELAPAYIDRQWDTTPAPQAEEITPPSQPVKTSPTGGEDLPQGADEFGLSGDDMAINDQEIERLKAEGKLSAEDQQALKDATDMTQRTDAYGKAIEAAASCLVRNP